MIQVVEEKFSVVEENQHLISEHWAEVVRDSRPLNIFWDFFRKTEDIGGLVTIVARDDEEVVGYAVFILQYHLHSKLILTGHNDAIFVRKDRRTRAGAKLLTAIEPILKNHGVNMVFMHVKPSVDFSPALKKLGFNYHESIWIKNIGGL